MIPVLSTAGSLFETSPLAQAPSSAVPQSPTAGTLDGGFGDIFRQVGEVVSNLQAGEAAAVSGLKGEMTIHNVVESIMTAERSLQTMIAIRDKIVSSYQAISQMQI
jgi:flagellar hook-basal body complex protein FliE